MRIDDRNGVAGTPAGRTADVEQVHGASGKAFSSLSRLGGDSVELSGASVAVRNFNSARDAKLQQLSQAVQSGSYSVNPASISKALVGETLANGQVS